MGYNFTASTLNILDECPRCFWLHFKKGIVRPRGAFPTLPSGIDRIIKEHFDSFRSKNELPPMLAQLKGKANLFKEYSLLSVWRNNLKGLNWKDDKGSVIKGAIDDLLIVDDKLVVLDFKTRGSAAKENTIDYYLPQLSIYNFLLRNNGHKTHDYAYLLFLHPEGILSSNEKTSIAFHSDLRKVEIKADDAVALIKRAYQILEGGIPKQSESCEYCRYVGEIKKKAPLAPGML
ncbi:MAG: PD-(D/E)XK nuclease family protein [Candidatus Woesearchaeota archaeon]